MFSAISKAILSLFGWKIEGAYPHHIPKKVLAVMPHTSNWDFPLGLLVRSAVGADIQYIGKSSLFKPPHGFLFRWLGGVPVDRSKRNGFVDAMVHLFNTRQKLTIVIAPEGTRKKVDQLRTGFYHIARRAGIPIILTQFDYPSKTVRFGAPFYPSDDMAADFHAIYDYFRGITGKHPELGFTPPDEI